MRRRPWTAETALAALFAPFFPTVQFLSCWLGVLYRVTTIRDASSVEVAGIDGKRANVSARQTTLDPSSLPCSISNTTASISSSSGGGSFVCVDCILCVLPPGGLCSHCQSDWRKDDANLTRVARVLGYPALPQLLHRQRGRVHRNAHTSADDVEQSRSASLLPSAQVSERPLFVLI